MSDDDEINKKLIKQESSKSFTLESLKNKFDIIQSFILLNTSERN